MPTLYGILSRGYFPKELPPAFTTNIYGAVLGKNLTTVPRDFKDYNSGKFSKNVTHNFIARGKLRRRLGIPNPIAFYKLTRYIVSQWRFLEGVTSLSQISMSTPITGLSPGRAIISKVPVSRYVDQRAYIRSKSRYILKADINQYYHSIYTHSISWAIHTKSVAKAKIHGNLQGNVLDRLIRNSQDRQTIGIPIGPDTSLLVAEIILSRNDQSLANKGIKNACRAVDDYEFGCDTFSDAESIRDILQETLNEYELTLNSNKTKIIELPIPIETPCISELRTYKFSSKQTKQRNEIINYFDKAFVFFRDCPEESVFKYAVLKLRSITIGQQNWTLYEDLLMQCVLIDPSSIEVVLNQLVRYRDSGYNLNLDRIQEVLNKLIFRRAQLGHGSEVAWAIWAIIVLNISVTDEAASIAANMNDSIVAILMLDARAKGFVSSSVSLDHFQSFMTTDNLYEDQWLLAYEADVKHWLPSVTRNNHVNKDMYFSFLKRNGVYFYDDTLSGKVEYEPPPYAPSDDY